MVEKLVISVWVCLGLIIFLEGAHKVAARRFMNDLAIPSWFNVRYVIETGTYRSTFSTAENIMLGIGSIIAVIYLCYC